MKPLSPGNGQRKAPKASPAAMTDKGKEFQMKKRTPTFIIAFCLPMIAILVLFPMYNRIEPFVFGFSFNYFWIFAWLFLTSLCLYAGYRLDPYNTQEGKDDSAKNLVEAKALLETEERGNQ